MTWLALSALVLVSLAIASINDPDERPKMQNMPLPRYRVRFVDIVAGLLGAAGVLGLLLFMLMTASARDNGQWEHVDPSIREWIESLRNKNNVGCCDTADGYDAQWDTLGPDGTYRVFIEGKWHVVPPEALLTVPNRLGVPKVWWVPGGDTGVIIRCFLPGAGA